MKKLSILGLFLIVSAPLHASIDEATDFKLSVTPLNEAEVLEVTQEAEQDEMAKNAIAAPARRGGDSILKQTADMAAIGDYVYTIVESNRPSINTSFSPMRVLPKVNGRIVDVNRLTDLKGRGARFSYVGTNVFGGEVARLDYTIVFWRAKYRTGKYLQSIVIKTNSSTGWGNRLDASAQLESIANRGTRAAPVAMAAITIKTKISNLFRSQENQDLILIDGLGRIQSM